MDHLRKFKGESNEGGDGNGKEEEQGEEQ